MSWYVGMHFVFDKKKLDKLDGIISWFRENSYLGEGMPDISKSPPKLGGESFDFCFSFKRTDDLEAEILSEGVYDSEELEELKEKWKRGYMSLGYYHLGLCDHDVFTDDDSRFVVDLYGAIESLGFLLVRSDTMLELMEEFCKKFKPKRAFLTADGSEQCEIWPRKSSVLSVRMELPRCPKCASWSAVPIIYDRTSEETGLVNVFHKTGHITEKSPKWHCKKCNHDWGRFR